ncbi:hypothetical protein BELL_0428g00070 [Botrytis elliptica]|uniref:Uncharacterized protein n=1 Tax=Botrytis elliptica TaxID=278938 RepID=A0A4Z1JUW8_9HELO|nr:hypothetical protein BELL_0428g00070 [Botrytis elliptica]
MGMQSEEPLRRLENGNGNVQARATSIDIWKMAGLRFVGRAIFERRTKETFIMGMTLLRLRRKRRVLSQNCVVVKE